jgi:hypothetical protein
MWREGGHYSCIGLTSQTIEKVEDEGLSVSLSLSHTHTPTQCERGGERRRGRDRETNEVVASWDGGDSACGKVRGPSEPVKVRRDGHSKKVGTGRASQLLCLIKDRLGRHKERVHLTLGSTRMV